MLTDTCPNCGDEYEVETVEWNGRTVFRQKYCFPCAETLQRREDEARNRAEAERRAKRISEAFDAICPPLYRSTDVDRLPEPFLTEAVGWEWSARGLGLVGLAGKGKTRTAYHILRRMLEQGKSVVATSAPSFARLCVDQFADDRQRRAEAESTLKQIHKADVWFLDDLGKQRMTDRGEMELYAVLEHRTASMLPTIWTANAKSAVLLEMFSQDRGEPIMRRLIDFSRIVAIWRDTPEQKQQQTHTTK
jgi:DNA replication protein DnaC